MTTPLNWGILATGGIAKKFAEGIVGSSTARLVAVGSRSQAAAEKFAAEHGNVRAHGTYEALIADPDVQAVYIATPHPGHFEWVLKAAAAGKHILCEKPMAMNARETQAMIDAARRHRVVLMEAFMYRCHPQTARVIELIESKAVGELRAIHANFTVKFNVDLSHRIFDKKLGGGGILDLGCYPMSYVRRVAGAAIGQPFANPVSLKGAGKLHAATGADEFAAATLLFPGDIVAQLTCGTTIPYEVGLRLICSEGVITIPHPFHPGRAETPAKIVVQRNGVGVAPEEEVLPKDPITLFARQADAVAAAVARAAVETSEMPLDDSLGNMAALDAWRAEIGLRYDGE